MKPKPKILAIDTGGTMTDTILVDDAGNFTIGKAHTTPDDESKGVVNSLKDALTYWGLSEREGAGGIQATIYSGTSILNKILTRSGEGPIGVIVTAGFEDCLRMGRAIQSYLGYSYPDRLHAVSHHHPPPPPFLSPLIGRPDSTGSEYFI